MQTLEAGILCVSVAILRESWGRRDSSRRSLDYLMLGVKMLADGRMGEQQMEMEMEMETKPQPVDQLSTIPSFIYRVFSYMVYGISVLTLPLRRRP